jgi:hypothetical protein
LHTVEAHGPHRLDHVVDGTPGFRLAVKLNPRSVAADEVRFEARQDQTSLEQIPLYHVEDVCEEGARVVIRGQGYEQDGVGMQPRASCQIHLRHRAVL